MDIYKMLDLLEKIESEAAELYEQLRKEHPSDKETADFFLEMQMEEEGHGRIVGMERRIVQAAPKSFSEPQVNLSEVNSLLAMITNLKAEKLPLAQLIPRIYALESCMAEKYLIDALKDTNEEIREFLLQLGDTCGSHHRGRGLCRQTGHPDEDAEAASLRTPRVGYRDKVVINGTMSVRASDISEGGMFLLTGRSFEPGTSVTVKFTVLDRPIEAEGAVEYTFPEVGMGVMFTRMEDPTAS